MEQRFVRGRAVPQNSIEGKAKHELSCNRLFPCYSCTVARQGETTARYLIQLDSLSAPNAKSTPTERRLLSQHVPALIASRDLSDA